MANPKTPRQPVPRDTVRAPGSAPAAHRDDSGHDRDDPHGDGDPRGGGDRRNQTRPQQFESSRPRLPHEHDLSPDSQRSGDDAPPAVGRRAYRDLREGLKDTDRGPVYDQLRKTLSRGG
ncbi:MAG: hypothetical protein QM766_23880 [Burkholderiaceae bacterium]